MTTHTYGRARRRVRSARAHGAGPPGSRKIPLLPQPQSGRARLHPPPPAPPAGAGVSSRPAPRSRRELQTTRRPGARRHSACQRLLGPSARPSGPARLPTGKGFRRTLGALAAPFPVRTRKRGGQGGKERADAGEGNAGAACPRGLAFWTGCGIGQPAQRGAACPRRLACGMPARRRRALTVIPSARRKAAAFRLQFSWCGWKLCRCCDFRPLGASAAVAFIRRRG